MIDSIGSKMKDYAPLVLRIGLGLLVILIAVREFREFRNAQQFATGAAMIGGGVLVIIGFLTRWAAMAILVAILFRILPYPGWRVVIDAGSQVWFTLIILSLGVYFSGGGKMSVDLKNKQKHDKG